MKSGFGAILLFYDFLQVFFILCQALLRIFNELQNQEIDMKSTIGEIILF